VGTGDGDCQKRTCIAVHSREDFDNFRRDMEIGSEVTFAEWTGALSKQIEKARDSGLTVFLTEIIYDDFRQYCRATGCKPDNKFLLSYSRFKKSNDVATSTGKHD